MYNLFCVYRETRLPLCRQNAAAIHSDRGVGALCFVSVYTHSFSFRRLFYRIRSLLVRCCCSVELLVLRCHLLCCEPLTTEQMSCVFHFFLSTCWNCVMWFYLIGNTNDYLCHLILGNSHHMCRSAYSGNCDSQKVWTTKKKHKDRRWKAI